MGTIELFLQLPKRGGQVGGISKKIQKRDIFLFWNFKWGIQEKGYPQDLVEGRDPGQGCQEELGGLDQVFAASLGVWNLNFWQRM